MASAYPFQTDHHLAYLYLKRAAAFSPPRHSATGPSPGCPRTTRLRVPDRSPANTTPARSNFHNRLSQRRIRYPL